MTAVSMDARLLEIDSVFPGSSEGKKSEQKAKGKTLATRTSTGMSGSI